MITTNKKYFHNMILCATFTFLFFMMSYNLMHSALWGDEWVEWTVFQKSISNNDMYNAIIATYQPPLYNFIMHFWLKISSSVEWFRFFNVLLGMLCGVYLYLTVTKISNWKTAVFSVFLLSQSFQWIYCIQECAEYSLMLFFLFAGLYYFVNVLLTPDIKVITAFVLCCTGAMYSQYGAVFVVVPMLIIIFIFVIQNGSRKIKAFITLLYTTVFLFAALPLYFRFAAIQMAGNGISENTSITVSLSDFLRIFTTFGTLCGYFYNLQGDAIWFIICQIISPVFLFSCVFLLTRKISQIKKHLVEVMLSAYVLHYFLVVFHIYAMIHPGQSAGFESRYSYFYIPVLVTILPVISSELLHELKHHDYLQSTLFSIASVCTIIICVISNISIMQNWTKAEDDRFSDVWIQNKGYEDITYLLGTAHYGFDYYVVRENAGTGIDYMCNIHNSDDLAAAMNNLPGRFWLWRTNWGGEKFDIAVNSAREAGYTVIIYADDGDIGQLAFCIAKQQ
jgi:hypothetical protein